jgi:hypothetical protein
MRISFSIVLAASLAPIVAGGAESANLIGDWTTFGNGPAHTSYFPGTLNGLPFVLKWKAPMPSGAVSQAAIVANRAYVVAGYYFNPMSLRAIDATTGQPIWTNNIVPACEINPPTCDSGSVYLERSNGSDSQLWSFDAITGQTNWKTSFISQCDNYYAPIVANGMVYCDTGYYGGLTGFNRTTGAQVFFANLSGGLGCDEWTPAYYNNKLYMWVNGYFSEHQPTTGTTNWILTNATPSEFLYSMDRTVAIADGRAYFTSTTKLFCVDLAAHVNAWSVTGPFSGTPAVANGYVYAITNGVVNAYTTNGDYVRTFQGTNGSSFSGQMIVTDDALIVAGSYGVYVFKLSDGIVQQYITSFRTPCYCYFLSKISLANNTLYISSGTSNVEAYSASNLFKFVVKSSSNPYGSPSPHYYGTNYVLSDSVVTNFIPSPIAAGTTTRYLVTGWSGTGSVPSSGNTNFVSFVATNESSLTWNFKTQYFLDTGVTSAGNVDVADTWVDSGSIVTITATPSNYYHFVNWSGDVSGTSNVIQVAMNSPRTVVANFAANLVTNGVPEWWLAQFNLPISDAGALADTDGDGFANWKEYRAGTNPRDPTSALRLTTLPGPSWNPTQIILTWPSAYGRTYRLLSTTNLSVPMYPLATNIYPSPPYNYYYLTVGNTERSFYLIQIE